MWTCKKCGNTEIMMKKVETIERVGRVLGKEKFEKILDKMQQLIYTYSIRR